jgi:hypothetical protein
VSLPSAVAALSARNAVEAIAAARPAARATTGQARKNPAKNLIEQVPIKLARLSIMEYSDCCLMIHLGRSAPSERPRKHSFCQLQSRHFRVRANRRQITSSQTTIE